MCYLNINKTVADPSDTFNLLVDNLMELIPDCCVCKLGNPNHPLSRPYARDNTNIPTQMHKQSYYESIFHDSMLEAFFFKIRFDLV